MMILSQFDILGNYIKSLYDWIQIEALDWEDILDEYHGVDKKHIFTILYLLSPKL